MASLGGPLALPLGGEGLTAGKPWLVNLRPAPEESDVQLLRPISFSIRDIETHIDPTTIQVASGYSSIYGDGAKFFDQAIPNTVRRGLVDTLVNREPLLSLIPNPPPDEAVRIKNASGLEERSVYFTKVGVDDTRAFRNVVVSGLIKPVTVTNEPSGGPYGYSGVVMGLELGPRNTSVLVFFRVVDNVNSILITGPLNQGGNLPQQLVEYDWSLNQRYTIFWNEARGIVQLFANNNELIAAANITDFPEFDTTAPRHGSSDEYVVVYGLQGAQDDEVEISAISFTDNMGYPLMGLTKPNFFTTVCRSAALVRTTQGVDPRKDAVSPWYDDKGAHFEIADEDGVAKMGSQGLQLARVTKNVRSLAIYREEPGFLLGNAEGYSIDLHFFGTSTVRDGDTTGMGLVVHDGFSVFQIACLQSAGTRLLGIRLNTGDSNDVTGYNTVAYDWTVPGATRFVVDGRAGRLRIYTHPRLETPILDLPLDRSIYPTPADLSWQNFTPFLGIGHYDAVEATGSFYLQESRHCHFYRAWESFSDLAPDDSSFILPFTRTGSGTAPSGAISGPLSIECTREQTLVYSIAAESDALRGMAFEARVAISGTDKLESSGDAIVFDDGVRRFLLSFTETEEGKFVCLALRAGIDDYQELVGFDGDGARLSFHIDWTQPHTYRLERKPGEGTFLFIDNDPRVRIFFPESNLAQLPSTSYTTPTVAFGHFHTNSPSSADWYFVRAFYSTGFEIAFKRNKPDLELKDQLFATESIVLVEASDTDPTPPPPTDCTGGAPLTMAGGVITCNFTSENDSQSDLYADMDWDAISDVGTTVKFHFSGHLTLTGGATSATIHLHVNGDSVFGSPGTVVDSFTLTSSGLFYHLTPAIALPTGQQRVWFSMICAPSGTAVVDNSVFAMEAQ